MELPQISLSVLRSWSVRIESLSEPMRFYVRQQLFRPGGARPQTEVMIKFIDQHRSIYGVEPICTVLPIAPSSYYRYKDLEQHPDKRSYRARRDDALAVEIRRVWDENHSVYGARKVWKQLNREWIFVARCTVESDA